MTIPAMNPTEPHRALMTPSASPSLGPPDPPRAKRPRLRSTPSSSISATPSTSNESTSSADVNSARRASTLRVLNTWAQLAERYNKRLDEDDIIDLHRYVIIKDRGAVEGASKEYHIGHFTQLDSDQDYPDADQDQEDSEQDDDDNELNASEPTTDDDVSISKKELLRGVPPLSATTDAEDLREFLEAERKRRELVGDDEDDEDMSTEQRSALRKELEERQRKKETAIANGARDEASTEPAREHDADATPTRPSTRVPLSDDESEDELALWTHDESTAVYPVTRHESEQDVHEVNQEVIELTESDSDEEFAAILTHPPRFARVSPLPVPQPKEVRQPLQSPPDSERGRFKSRTRSHSKIKLAEAMPRTEDRAPSPHVARKPEVALTPKKKPSSREAITVCGWSSDQEVASLISPVHKDNDKGNKRKPSVSKETGTVVSNVGRSASEVVCHIPLAHKGKRKPSISKEIGTMISDEDGLASEADGRIPPAHKGKGKDTPLPVEDTHQEKTPKSFGVRRGRKRKRIPSSLISGSPLAQSPGEPESTSRSHGKGKSTSQGFTAFQQPHSFRLTMDRDTSTPVQFEPTVPGPSRSLSLSPTSKTQLLTMSAPACRPIEPESVQLSSHDHNFSRPLVSDLPIPVTHPYPQRHPSHPPSIFSSPNQGTPGLSLPAHPPPPMDPVQTQQAQYLLAQAMHQLSYLLSTAMLPYAAYTSNSGQPWHHPPPPLNPGYSTPIHYHPHYHDTCHYHTPPSSMPRSGLSSSSLAVRSSVSPPVEEQHTRGQSKSRGRRVSFRLDSDEVITATQPELQHSGQRNRKQSLEVKRERGKGKATPTDERDDSEDRGSPPRGVTRGRTPGPPGRKKLDASRGRPLSRR